MVIYFSAVLFLLQQFALRQYGEVLGYRWSGSVKIGRNGAGRHGMGGYQYEYRSPCWIGYGLEYISS